MRLSKRRQNVSASIRSVLFHCARDFVPLFVCMFCVVLWCVVVWCDVCVVCVRACVRACVRVCVCVCVCVLAVGCFRFLGQNVHPLPLGVLGACLILLKVLSHCGQLIKRGQKRKADFSFGRMTDLSQPNRSPASGFCLDCFMEGALVLLARERELSSSQWCGKGGWGLKRLFRSSDMQYGTWQKRLMVVSRAHIFCWRAGGETVCVNCL